MVKAQSRPAESMEPEVFLSNHRRIAERIRAAEESAASGKAAVNSAKAAGFNVQAYKFVRKLSKMDRGDAERLIRDALVYSRFLDLGLFDQRDLFATIDGKNDADPMASLTASVVQGHKEWEAEQAGYQNGRVNDPLDNNPYLPGTAMHERYIVGWRDGEASRREAEARGEQVIKAKKGRGAEEDDGE